MALVQGSKSFFLIAYQIGQRAGKIFHDRARVTQQQDMDRGFADQITVARPFDCESVDFGLHVTDLTALFIHSSFAIIISWAFRYKFMELTEFKRILRENSHCRSA